MNIKQNSRVARLSLWLALMVGLAPATYATVSGTSDAYRTRSGAVLTVSGADGVLKNDSTTAPPLVIIDYRADTGVGSVVVAPDGGFVFTPAPGYLGEARFRYRVQDASGDKQEMDVFVTVDPANFPPMADDQSVTLDEDSSASIVLTGSDGDSDPLVYQLVDGPANGTLSGSGAALIYTPTGNFNGDDAFTFRVFDGYDYSSPAKVSLTINPVNDVPVANGQAVTASEDTPVSINLSGSDADGDALIFEVVGGPASGTLSGSGATLSYLPNANFHGSDGFTFTARDSSGAVSATATVSITVSPVNDAPLANAVTASTSEDVPVGITLSGSDPDGDSITAYTVVGAPSRGTLSGAAPNLTYTPNPNANGSDSFTYTVSDGSATSAPATVNVSISAVNDPPVANAQSVSVNEDISVGIALSGSDADGDPLNYSISTPPSNGTLTGTPPNVTYQGATNYNGPDSFKFTVTDGQGGSSSALVSISVAAINDRPIANGQTVTTLEDTAVAVTLTGSDIEGSTLNYSIRSFPANGTLSGSGANRTYTPNPNFNGTDTFRFRVSDGSLNSLEATVTVNVTAVNDVPVTSAVAVTTNEDTPVPVTLPGSDVDGNPLTFTVVTQPTNGALGGSGANLTYTPAANFNGADSFQFTVSDGTLTTPVTTASITVTPVNDLPSAGDLAKATDEDTPLSGQLPAASDVDDDPIAYSLASQASNGTAAVDATGGFTYTPAPNFNGSDSFRYGIDDGNGGTASYQVTVDVAAVNDAPVVLNPVGEVRSPEDGPNVVIDLANVFGDVDIATNGDSLALALVSLDKDNPALFTTEDFSGTTLTLDPAPEQFGTATITISATDRDGAAVIDTFTVVIKSVNDLPVAEDDTVSMAEGGGTLTIAVLANDYLGEEPTRIVSAGTEGYSDSDPVTILDILGNPVSWPDGSNSNGRVTFEDDQIIYEPKPFYYGTDTFTYTIEDSDGDTATATVTVTVTPVNSAPQGPQERTFYMQESGTLEVPAAEGLLATAYDPDNARLGTDGAAVATQALSIQVSPPTVGELLDFDIATGSFIYQPPTPFVGEATFTYRLTDGETFSTPASLVRILVLASPPAAEPPVPGQVAIPFNLSNVPLEQSTGVPPNVLVVMDDSFSMDYQMVVPAGADEALMLLDNSPVSRRPVAQAYGYLYDLPSNSMQSTTAAGAVLPTEEALAANANFLNNQYGVWRARNHLFNTLYYDPAKRYTPWVGSDVLNVAFTDADPAAVRLDPIDPSRTINILNDHTYLARNVPRWGNTNQRSNVNVTVYIPHYYTTTASAPLAWNAPSTKVEIRNVGGAPYVGGPDRADCAVDDGNPLDCTYAQEIRNFANWFQYYRSREYVTKASMGKVVSQVQDVRLGYLTISATTTEDIREMNDLYTEGNKKILMDNIYAVESSSEGSPQRQLLKRAGDTFACARGGMTCPRLPEPAGFCQQNFALLMTDGYWSQGTGVSSNEDANSANPFDGGRYADSYSSTLADTAMYYYKTDLWPEGDDLVPIGRRDELGAPEGTFDGDEPRMHQHMKTYSIAFGVKGTIDESDLPLDPTEAFAWPDPLNAPAYKIDDVLHAATNGRGQYLNASNPQQLQTALENAFLEFTQAASSTSSAAFNSTSLEEGTLLYRGFYDLRYNIGELMATRVNSDGSLADAPLWKASEKLEAPDAPARVIVTYDRGGRKGVPFRYDSLNADQKLVLASDEVAFLRGDRSVEAPDGSLRTREQTGGLLGDIVNSSPVFVGPPRSINRDQAPYPIDSLYSEFAADYYDRDPIVYVGANDGMLHGFDARYGFERFAYVPNKLIDASLGYRNVLDQFASPFYQHRYFVDLTPRLNDVYITPDGSATKQWRTVLVGGLGAGGKGLYALDVTDPSIYGDESDAAAAVLWEFTDEDDTYPVDADGLPLGGSVGAITDPFGAPVKDLGYSMSLPTIAMSNVDDSGATVSKEWVAIFGNGQNSTSGIAKLFVLFVDKGKDGWADGDFVKLDTGFGVPLSPHPLTGFPNGLGTPTAVDSDLNGTVDLVYAGDRLGNLYRFDLSDADPANWKSTRLFTASYTEGGVNTIQPILAQPLVIKHPTEQGFLVIFGTGSYFTRDDARNEDIQSIYAIWDRGENNPATAAADSRERRLVEQEMTNVVDDSLVAQLGPDAAITRRVFLGTQTVDYQTQSCSTADCSAADDKPGVYGWYVDLDMPRATQSVTGDPVLDTSGREPPSPQYPGERAIRRIVERNGNLVTTTVLPALDEFSCFGTRPGAILVLSALTGGDAEDPLIDFNNDGKIDAQDLLNLGEEYYSGGLLLDQTDLDGQLVDLSTLGGIGDTDFLFVSGGNDTVAYLIEGIEDQRAGRLSWRELESAD